MFYVIQQGFQHLLLLRQDSLQKYHYLILVLQDKCKLHPETIEGNEFVSTATGQSYNIRDNLGCDSHNIIYLATCNKPDCRQQYVGETGRRLKDRAPEHIRTIKNSLEIAQGKKRKNLRKKNPVNCPVGAHFSSPNHLVNNFTIQAIEHCKINDTCYRRCRENYWKGILKPEINGQSCGNKPRPPYRKSPQKSTHRGPFFVHNKKKKIPKK